MTSLCPSSLTSPNIPEERGKCGNLSSHLNMNAQFVSPSFPLPANPSLIPGIPFLALPHVAKWEFPLSPTHFPRNSPSQAKQFLIPDFLLPIDYAPSLQFLEFSSWGSHLIQIVCINNAYFAFLGG